MPRNTMIGQDPSGKTVYIPANTQEAALRGAVSGAMESAPVQGLGKILGGAAHALSAPFRAVSAIGQNLAGTGKRVDVSDAALYGRDMNTGQAPQGYGTLLRKSMVGEEGAGDAPTGYWADKFADLTEFAGNLISDPVALGAGVGAAGGSLRVAEAGAAVRNPVLAKVGASRMQPSGGPSGRLTHYGMSSDPSQLRRVAPGIGRSEAAMLPENEPLLRRMWRMGDDEAERALQQEGFLSDPPMRGGALVDTSYPRVGPQARPQPALGQGGGGPRLSQPGTRRGGPGAPPSEATRRGLGERSPYEAQPLDRDLAYPRGPGSGLGPGAASSKEALARAARRKAADEAYRRSLAEGASEEVARINAYSAQTGRPPSPMDLSMLRGGNWH